MGFCPFLSLPLVGETSPLGWNWEYYSPFSSSPLKNKAKQNQKPRSETFINDEICRHIRQEFASTPTLGFKKCCISCVSPNQIWICSELPSGRVWWGRKGRGEGEWESNVSYCTKVIGSLLKVEQWERVYPKQCGWVLKDGGNPPNREGIWRLKSEAGSSI